MHLLKDVHFIVIGKIIGKLLILEEYNMNIRTAKKLLCTFIAAAMTIGGTGSSAIFECFGAETSTITAEFEKGATSGGKIYSEGWSGKNEAGDAYDLTNASGGAFSYLDQKGTKVSVEVTVPETGLYNLNICYCQPNDTNKKVQYLNVNGKNQGEVTFPYNLKFEETSAGIVMLQKGSNTIEFEGYWGYTYFDYLKVSPADESVTSLKPSRTLSNAKASDSTKRLYNYLCDTYGKHIISGQQEYCGSHNYNLYADPTNFIKDNEAEFTYIKEKTGKMCAIRGIDFLNYGTCSGWDDNAAERAAQWVNEYKGIATITWHLSVPSKEGDTTGAFYVKSASATYTTFSISNALKEGTWENKVLMKDIEIIAGKLKILKDADVPVLWRPLHEAEGGWFWWGAEGAEPCKKLYRLLYDQLTNVYGLDNLIWVWTGSTSPNASKWYPGDDVVDIVGYDKYNAKDGLPNLSAISATFYSLVSGVNGNKMVTMSENDTIPSLDNLTSEKAGWLYFCPWYMNYLTSEQNNPVDNLVEVYNSDYCITLDELPDLKTYPMASEQPSATTSTTSSSATTASKSATMLGDANCDGKIDISDVVAVRRFLINSEKFSLSANGLANADVHESGNGINAQDAVAIQKTVFGLK